MLHFSAAASQGARYAQGAGAGDKYAVLPPSSEDELANAEVHSRLNRALRFLQRDLGYALLEDVKVSPHGHAVIDTREKKLPDPFSRRIPAEEPEPEQATTRPKNKYGKADENTVNTDEVVVEVQTVATISANAARYAMYDDDLMLVKRFVQLLCSSGESNVVVEQKFTGVISDELYKMLLRGIRLLHLCEYDYADIVLVLVHASVYFRAAYVAIGHKMDASEVAHVCVLLMYLAHSFLLDETCPLRCWQRHLFRQYCTLRVLNDALFRLFTMRAFVLRISEEDLKHALRGISKGPNTPGRLQLPEEGSCALNSHGTLDRVARAILMDRAA